MSKDIYRRDDDRSRAPERPEVPVRPLRDPAFYQEGAAGYNESSPRNRGSAPYGQQYSPESEVRYPEPQQNPDMAAPYGGRSISQNLEDPRHRQGGGTPNENVPRYRSPMPQGQDLGAQRYPSPSQNLDADAGAYRQQQQAQSTERSVYRAAPPNMDAGSPGYRAPQQPPNAERPVYRAPTQGLDAGAPAYRGPQQPPSAERPAYRTAPQQLRPESGAPDIRSRYAPQEGTQEPMRQNRFEFEDDNTPRNNTPARGASSRRLQEEDYDMDDDRYYDDDEEDDYDEKPSRRNKLDKSSRATPKKKGKKGCLIAVVLAMALVMALSTLGYLFVVNELAGKNATLVGETVVEVFEGDSPPTIAERLKNSGLISSDLIFRIYVQNKNVAGEFQVGSFKLTGGMSYDEIIAKLTAKGETRESISITFPEGKSAIGFGVILEKAGLCTVEEFLDVANNGDFSDIPFFAKLDFDDNTYMRAEGYLAPNTYDFFVDESVYNIVHKLYSQFDTQMTPEIYARMEEQGMSLRETITLASLVQAEAGKADEDRLDYEGNQHKVAGVFWNRLQPGSPFPKLGSEVTIYYIHEIIAWSYGNDYKNVPKELYNAYHTEERNPDSCTGLPAGPIGAPGFAAIEASLWPTGHEYYFFNTDKAGKYYYAVTYPEHLRNLEEMKRVNAAIGDKSAA